MVVFRGFIEEFAPLVELEDKLGSTLRHELFLFPLQDEQLLPVHFPDQLQTVDNLDVLDHLAAAVQFKPALADI